MTRAMQHVARLFTDAKPYSELHGNTRVTRAAADDTGTASRRGNWAARSSVAFLNGLNGPMPLVPSVLGDDAITRRSRNLECF
jgi:hypothetical protein